MADNDTLVTSIEAFRALMTGLGLSEEQQEFLLGGLITAPAQVNLPA